MPVADAKLLGFTENSPGIPADGKTITRFTGTWGDLSTQSFYPPHHITMGEGGAVNIVSHPPLKKIVESFRDWGRDCWCPSGKDNTCGKRFGWKFGALPEGYDHKYIYSHLGYNLKPLDLQAAIGRIQLKRLPVFVKARKHNWNYLRAALDSVSDHFEFSLPTHASEWRSGKFVWKSDHQTNPSWFGFMVRPAKNSRGDVRTLARYLDRAGVGNRMLFGGNLIRQPVFCELLKECSQPFRIMESLKGADILMDQALFVGVYPGLSEAGLNRTVHEIIQWSQNHK